MGFGAVDTENSAWPKHTRIPCFPNQGIGYLGPCWRPSIHRKVQVLGVWAIGYFRMEFYSLLPTQGPADTHIYTQEASIEFLGSFHVLFHLGWPLKPF